MSSVKSQLVSPQSNQPIERIVVALIHPSNYDHNHSKAGGSFVQTYLLGVIPSNTLRLLESLTRDVLGGVDFDHVETEVHAFEDGIYWQQRAFRKLLKRFPEKGTMLIVGLVAVQSNQFPRACDLMHAAKAHGAMCVIGGPHITASINTAYYGISTIDPMRAGVVCPKKMPPEIEALIHDPRIIVFHGDADNQGSWGALLRKIVQGDAPAYHEGGLASDVGEPGGVYTNAQLDSFVTPVAAVDTERGCPFKCKFCAAIQAHGRTVRCREPQRVVDWVRRQCTSYTKSVTVLFASDNLARNPHWRELLKGLQALRREGHKFTIWAEADVRCNAGPNAGFLEEFAAAGGQGLFLGIESMNPLNITDAGKKQNCVDELPAFFAECRAHGIAPEGGYIIGFQHDTPESIASDVQRLVDAGLSRAWFFVKTLLPGSQDWIEHAMAGKWMDPDLNNYDSTVVMYDHEKMTNAEWAKAYDQAVRTFYNAKNMVTILCSYPDPEQRWRLIKGFLWCRWAYLTEGSHPMIAGLYRFRSFSERRPGQEPLSIFAYLASEFLRHLRYLRDVFAEFYLFQQVILETEWRLRYAEHFEQMPAGIRGWMKRTLALPMRRKWLNDFWKRYGSQKWKLLHPGSIAWHLKMIPFAATEVVYTIRFMFLFLRGLQNGK